MAAPSVYTGIATGQFNELLHEDMLPEIKNQIYEGFPWLKFIQKGTEKIDHVGRSFQVRIPIKVGRNESYGSRSAGGALPTHGRGAYDHFLVTLGRAYGRAAWDGAVLRGKFGKNAIADAMDLEMEDLVETFKMEMNRQIQGDGSGAMATILSTGATADNFTVDNAMFLRPGMRIDSYSAKTGGSQSLDSVTIESVDYINNTVTLTASATFAQNDFIFREDSRGLEAMGLEGHVDDGTVVATYQGKARTDPMFDSVLIDANGDALTEQQIDDAIAYVRKLTGAMGEIDFLGSGDFTANWWKKLLQSERRQINTTELKGGVKALAYVSGSRTIPWFTDPTFPDATIYGLSTKNFAFFEASDGPEWMDLDGAILNRAADADAYEATLLQYWNFGGYRPNAHFRLDGFVQP